MLPEQNDDKDAGIQGSPFTERDIREAARLLGLILSHETKKHHEAARGLTIQRPSSAPDRELLLSRAKQHFRDRQLRRQYFSRVIFGEPAWDTLLVLYISEFSGRRLTISRVADWIETPLSTTQRWISYLQKEYLVGREGNPDDKRMAYVGLLDKGRTALDDYFTSGTE